MLSSQRNFALNPDLKRKREREKEREKERKREMRIMRVAKKKKLCHLSSVSGGAWSCPLFCYAGRLAWL
jgi:hypothetical protein